MRWLIVAIAIMAATPAAADTGVYLEEAFGGGGYQGELSRYGDGAPRVQIGFGVRRGDWTVEALGSFSVPVTSSAAQPTRVWDTITVAAAFAAMPNSRRRSTFTAAAVRSGSRFMVLA